MEEGGVSCIRSPLTKRRPRDPNISTRSENIYPAEENIYSTDLCWSVESREVWLQTLHCCTLKSGHLQETTELREQPGLRRSNALKAHHAPAFPPPLRVPKQFVARLTSQGGAEAFTEELKRLFLDRPVQRGSLCR